MYFKRNIFRLVLALFTVLSISVQNILAEEEKSEEAVASEFVDSAKTEEAVAMDEVKEEAFNPAELIFEHISDSHQWHLWGDHGHSTHLPLPVILWTDKGLEMFSSSHLEHHEDIYQGKYYGYRLEHEHIEVVKADGQTDEEATAKIIDISITKNVAQMLLSAALLVLIFSSVAKAYAKTGLNSAPKGLQSFMEPLIMFVRDDIAIPNIGEKKYERFLPFLLTVFFFIWINNMLGLLPIGANLTGNIAFTLTMGVITLILTVINGNKHYWAHIFAPSVPAWLLPIMIPVEVIGILSKPFALIIRLFANITAGHIIVISLISLIFIFKSIAIAPVSIAFVLFMDVLELLVAFLQAYIFTMLTALFIGSAMADHEEHAHEGAEEHH